MGHNDLNRKQSFFGDLFGFLKETKKWWLFPIVIVVLLLGALIILGSSAVGPFVYTLF